MSDSCVRPLILRGFTVRNNLFQAPLAGYSCAPFRLLAWRLGKPGLLFTEMISANALAQNVASQEKYLLKLPGEGAVAFQLWGREPNALGQAARIAEERGADAVDLNCGCPVRKVRAAGAGSRLMEEPERIGRIVKIMRQNTTRPLSIKIRVGPNNSICNAVEIARIAEAEGADFVTVHGRHAGEAYGTPCRYGEIAKVVQALGIPVIGNGDVRDGATARRMFMETGCAGAMVGRACMGAPWVFARIEEELTGKAFDGPPLEEVGSLFLQHHDLLVDLIGADKAIRQCRKLGSFYSRSIPGAREFRNRLNFCNSRDDLLALVHECFGVGKGSAR